MGFMMLDMIITMEAMKWGIRCAKNALTVVPNNKFNHIAPVAAIWIDRKKEQKKCIFLYFLLFFC